MSNCPTGFPTIAATILRVGARYGLRGARAPVEPAGVLARIEPGGRRGVDFAKAWAHLVRRRLRRAGLVVPDQLFGLAWSGGLDAARLLGTPVRVSNVEPGLSGTTEFSNVRFKGDDDKAAKTYDGTQPLTADDIADTVVWLATRPAHVNINSVQMMPVCQAFGGMTIKRG